MEDFLKYHINGVNVEVVNLSRATYKEASQLREILEDNITRKRKKIVVDISQCEFIDSTFLGVLVISLKKISRIGGDIRLVKPHYLVRTLMEKAGTMNVFNVYENLDEAVESFTFTDAENYYLSRGAAIQA